MSKIRKNSRARAQILRDAKNVRVFSLSNGFTGKPAQGPIASYDQENGDLYQRGTTYSLTVHSNLWYEWSAGK